VRNAKSSIGVILRDLPIRSSNRGSGVRLHTFAKTAIVGSLALLGALTMAATDAPTYRITRSISLGSPDSWDYVAYDESSHHVFVSHFDRVTVVDEPSGTVIGQVTSFPGGTHGIAISAAQHRGYTDDSAAGIAASFDLSTFMVQKRLQAKDDADGMAFDPKTDAVIANVSVGSKLEFAVAGRNGKLYVNDAGKNEIVRIDTKTNQIDAHWPMAGCERPHGLAIDSETHRLFSTCPNQVMEVVNAENGAIVATLPIGKGTDAAAFDPKRKRAFSSNGQDGTLTVVQELGPNSFIVIDTVSTAVSGRTMAIDPDSGRIFIAAAQVVDESPAPSSAALPAASGNAPGASPRRRLPIVPGSLKLLILDPAS
jgi:DNA-binding beta-propeller fold protein YncE